MIADDDRALVRRLMTPPGDHSPEMVALLLGQSAGTISRLLAENKRLQDQLHTLTLGTGKKFAALEERREAALEIAMDVLSDAPNYDADHRIVASDTILRIVQELGQ